MSARQYRRGARLERLARADLERQGYTVTPANTAGGCRCGVRSAGSKGAVGLAAFNARHILLIQVKASRVRPVDCRRLAGFPAPPAAVRQMWVRAGSGWTITDIRAGGAVQKRLPAPNQFRRRHSS